MRIPDETATSVQIMYLHVVSAEGGPRGMPSERNLKGDAGRKSWRCWEALQGEKLRSRDKHQGITGRKSCGQRRKSGASWMEFTKAEVRQTQI
jgi:hypothetical protein